MAKGKKGKKLAKGKKIEKKQTLSFSFGASNPA